AELERTIGRQLESVWPNKRPSHYRGHGGGRGGFGRLGGGHYGHGWGPAWQGPPPGYWGSNNQQWVNPQGLHGPPRRGRGGALPGRGNGGGYHRGGGNCGAEVPSVSVATTDVHSNKNDIGAAERQGLTSVAAILGAEAGGVVNAESVATCRFPPEFPPGSTIAPPDADYGVNQVGKTTGNVTGVNALRLGTRSRELALGKLEHQQGRRPVGQEARGDAVPLIPAKVKLRPESRPEEKSELRPQSRLQTSDVFAPVIAFQYRKPEWQKRKLVIQRDDVVDVQAIWTVTLHPGETASIPVPLNYSVHGGARERARGATYASALNIDEWQRWATEDTTVHVRRVQARAQWPERTTEGAAGLDLHICESGSILPGERKKINTGLSLAIPGVYAGKIMGRSGLALQSIDVHPGLIDSDYRGELAIIAINNSRKEFFFKAGDRLAQLVVQAIPKITLQAANDNGVVDADTARGT
ncbi:MAG: hypothetical protein BJ554DRAFT_6520, partial [Olpidium bornovanus]